MMIITMHPIGYIHTPYTDPKGAPIQPRYGDKVSGTVEILPEYAEGLSDLDGFSHIYLLFHLHLSSEYKLKVTPFLDDQLRGVFATRAPRRPNPIGLSLVRLIKIESNILHIENPDMVDGTPLLDIKPYVSAFEDIGDHRIGWLTGKAGKAGKRKADDRFDR
ncbi:MAG: tRNA (N6-threonylcarbamoyladenosine(37)-N6)-methyltransferase TrmO [FCB group bacterium]|nr:tRNA (N6-threonylcarbamoyladenosine(37)-N6)-methyltransferase TrmO [FCB group bacterium]